MILYFEHKCSLYLRNIRLYFPAVTWICNITESGGEDSYHTTAVNVAVYDHLLYSKNLLRAPFSPVNGANISLWYCILSTSVHCICEILDYIFQYLLLLKCLFTELTTRYCNALQVWKCDCYRGISLIQTFKYFGSQMAYKQILQNYNI
jgi:hypothetical protein